MSKQNFLMREPLINPVIHKEEMKLMDIVRIEDNNVICRYYDYEVDEELIETHPISNIFRCTGLTKNAKVVALRSGSPPLDVVCMEGDNVFVKWFDDFGDKHNRSFPVGCLYECIDFAKNMELIPKPYYPISPGLGINDKPACPYCSNSKRHLRFTDKNILLCSKCRGIFRRRA